jgi:hypothetical protein
MKKKFTRKRKANYGFKVFREDVNEVIEKVDASMMVFTTTLLTKKTRQLNREIGVI